MAERRVRDWCDPVDREAWLDFVAACPGGVLLTGVDRTLEGVQFYLGDDAIFLSPRLDEILVAYAESIGKGAVEVRASEMN